MSFVGGGAECSANNNAISQFNKHNHQDRSLQQQAANRSSVANNSQGFRQGKFMNLQDRQNMDQFMNNGGNQNNFQFQSMRRELNTIQPGGAQQAHPNNWSGEFQGISSATAVNKPVASLYTPMNTQWGMEFQQNGGEAALSQPNQQFNSVPSMRMGGMRPMGPLFRSGIQNHGKITELQEQNSQVDWEGQFKEIEDLSVDAKEQEDNAADIEREYSPEIVVDDKFQATFQDVWDGLNSEEVENEFINRQYEEFKASKLDTLAPDMAQWERDFSRYASTRSHFGQYKFEDKERNQFLDLPKEQDPYEVGLQLMAHGAKLSEAALAFEAAIQRDESHIGAWLKLGEVQTQNEKEIAGIAALEKCLELHPENSEALMNLAISYINEGYDNAAFATLERWISTKYPQVTEKARSENPSIDDEDRFSLNKRVTDLFLMAAQVSPDYANMDPDVQLGLGVLFYANEDFDKTIDCFKAALSMNPDDAVMWNRLGASLANSNRSEEAVNAYFKALELKPTFVRARYNLGVSCINIGCYKEAVEHLLSGLAMHQVEGANEVGSTLNHNQSTSLTETLKRAFIAMDRRDLLDLVKPGMDLNAFRGEFNF